MQFVTVQPARRAPTLTFEGSFLNGTNPCVTQLAFQGPEIHIEARAGHHKIIRSQLDN